jgi:hypothetical protein
METQGQALKRKYDALQRENDVYTELFELIRKSSDEESLEIVRRIKIGTDVVDVLNRIKEADLLMRLTVREEAGPEPSNATIPERIEFSDNLYYGPSSSGPSLDEASYPTLDTPAGKPFP